MGTSLAPEVSLGLKAARTVWGGIKVLGLFLYALAALGLCALCCGPFLLLAAFLLFEITRSLIGFPLQHLLEWIGVLDSGSPTRIPEFTGYAGVALPIFLFGLAHLSSLLMDRRRDRNTRAARVESGTPRPGLAATREPHCPAWVPAVAPAPATRPSPPTIRSATPITAWRAWILTPMGGDPYSPVLESVSARTAWLQREIVAECRGGTSTIGPGEHGPVPDLACTCGIYGLKEPPHPALWRHGLVVSGRVDLAGRVLEGSLGYRAGRARIKGPLHASLRCLGTRGSSAPCREPSVAVLISPRGHFLQRVSGYLPLCAVHAPDPRQAEPAVRSLLVSRRMPLEDFKVMARALIESRYGVDAEWEAL